MNNENVENRWDVQRCVPPPPHAAAADRAAVGARVN